MAQPQRSVRRMDADLQNLAVSMWGPLAVRLGIRLGIHGGQPCFEVNDEIVEIVKSSAGQSWLTRPGGSLTLLVQRFNPIAFGKNDSLLDRCSVESLVRCRGAFVAEGFIGESFSRKFHPSLLLFNLFTRC